MINEYVEEVRSNPTLILTEADIQMQLFQKLVKNSNFDGLHLTFDKQRTYKVHGEVSYFGENGHLNNRVDLAVLDVSQLDTYAGKVRRGKELTKGYAFGGSSVGIELKLNRNRCKKRFFDDCRKDVRKIVRLKSTRPDTEFISLCFDKKLRFNDEDRKALESEANKGGVTFIYVPLEVRND